MPATFCGEVRAPAAMRSAKSPVKAVVVAEVVPGVCLSVAAEADVGEGGQAGSSCTAGLAPGPPRLVRTLDNACGPPPPTIQPTPNSVMRRKAATAPPPITRAGPQGCTGADPINPA